jgi:hypothetical protein
MIGTGRVTPEKVKAAEHLAYLAMTGARRGV